MLPVIALIGNTNVGKSTLFNRLTKSNDAIVDDTIGLTRDRQYGEMIVDSHKFIVVDTAGFVGDPTHFDQSVLAQSELAIEEADILFFMIDLRAGISAMDEAIAEKLRKSAKVVFLIANKIDGIDVNQAMSDCYRLGFDHIYPISASHGRGVAKLMQAVLKAVEPLELAESGDENLFQGIKIAIVGRPNVGKSTLVNRMLGEERVVVFDRPGTTRDSIYIPFERFDEKYVLIDTAGIRRRKNIREKIEKISIIKTLQAIDEADVVIQIYDAREGIVDQDLHLAGFILDKGKCLIMAINKWDGLDIDIKKRIHDQLDRKLTFAEFVPLKFISALHGTGVGHLFDDVKTCYESVRQHWSTKQLTELLLEFVEHHQPPMVRGRRIKLRFAHQGGKFPPMIIIHGNQTENVPEHYRRYLSKAYQQTMKVVGAPVKIEFKSGDNPFKNRSNPLTDRQVKKRRRLMAHSKKLARKKRK